MASVINLKKKFLPVIKGKNKLSETINGVKIDKNIREMIDFFKKFSIRKIILRLKK
jgi:hypothetical protein